MRPGTWDGAVSTDNVRVWVNGTLRPVRSVKIQSGMRDGHPASDHGSWCVEATIEWEDPALVVADSPHLFGSGATDWLPRAGDSVVIETGDGAQGQSGKWWVQHRGVIDDTTGSIADGTATSTTVDNIEDLSGRVQFGALLARMTPWSNAHDYRWIGLSSIWMVDRMWRNPQTEGIGWYATPPVTWQTVASAPMNGSAWPEVGTLRICGRSYSEQNTQIHGWADTSYGMCPFGMYSEYLFASSVPEVVLSVSTEHSTSGWGRWRVQDENRHGPFIQVDGAEGLIRYGHTTTGTQEWTLPIGSAKRAALFFKRDTMTSQTMILRTDDGREVTRTGTSSKYPVGFAMDRITVDTDSQGRAPWWMVEGEKPASQRWHTLDHVPTARLRRGADVRWAASRDLPFTMPSTWLQEQVDAEGACMWLDEDNVMQWASRGVLEAQNRAQTITSVRDVDDIQWEQRRSALARGVWVNFLEPQVRTLLGGFRQNCWGTNSIDLAPGESETIIVPVPDDEDWISVDLESSLMSQYMEPQHLRMGSKHGGTQYKETSQGETNQTWAQFINYSLQRRGLRNFVVFYAPWTNLGSDVRVKSAIPNLNDKDTRPSANVDAWHSGNDAVRIRSRGIVRWSEGERSLVAGQIGPARHTLDVGWRVQTTHIVDSVGELLSWLRTQVMQTTRPRVTGLVVAHDPRRQIGDKIRVQDTAVTGIDFEMLIQEKTTDTGAFTDTIDGRVTTVFSHEPSGALVTDWTTRQAPHGPTPMTPETDWTREVVS